MVPIAPPQLPDPEENSRTELLLPAGPLATPIGIKMRCRTCHYWWGFADRGWCYAAESYHDGAIQCADWVMRESGWVGFCEGVADDLLKEEGTTETEKTVDTEDGGDEDE